ncbi:MAG: hypothetical protein LUQ65_09720, partial [Candidatus Helarchaeota archaeon]|nr:hypothetical protein [Candidatus Helarchaeota archaeon]
MKIVRFFTLEQVTTRKMGLIAGVASRDGSDISKFLEIMTRKLAYRGNSPFCIFKRGENGWDLVITEHPEEISTVQTSFGIVGRYLLLEKEDTPIPYVDCQLNRFLVLDGRSFNNLEIRHKMDNNHSCNLRSSSIVIHFFEELQDRIFDFTQIFSKVYDSLEGMFAGALLLANHVFLFRDLLGIKPLHLYSGPKYVAFASEQKALWAIGFTPSQPLPPGRVVRVAEKGFTSIFQADFQGTDFIERSIAYYSEAALQLLRTNLSKLTPRNPFYMLLSGGLDSTLLATCLKKLNIPFTSLVAG